MLPSSPVSEKLVQQAHQVGAVRQGTGRASGLSKERVSSIVPLAAGLPNTVWIRSDDARILYKRAAN